MDLLVPRTESHFFVLAKKLTLCYIIKKGHQSAFLSKDTKQ